MKNNRIFLKLKGLNQERIINSLSKKIKIYNLKRDKYNICTLEVDYKDKKQTLNLLKQENIEILEVSSQGLKWKIKKLITSYGLMVGVFLCSLLYIFQYNFVLDIKVFGNENLNKKEILTFVDKNIKSKWKSNINTKEIEFNLVNSYKEISSASVVIVGQTLIININEAVIPDEMQNDNNVIVSQFDGMITDISLVQGTLAVDVGDIVKKGDVLVYPYIIDSQGEKRDVVAKADIWADVWLSEKVVHYDYTISTQRTGKKQAFSEVYLFDLLIYSNTEQCKYEEYEIEESECYLTKNNILPFVLKKKTYYQLESKEVLIEFENVKDNIIQKAREKTLIFLQENEIIKEEKTNIREFGGIHEVVYLITVNRNIGDVNAN